MMSEQDWPGPAPERTTVLIGDIHGCMAQLTRLMEGIEADLRRDATGPAHIVFLGDYVDRGPASSEVLQDLHHRQRTAPDTYVCLMGNHERMMLDFTEDPTGRARRWLRHGGRDTLQSFGLSDVDGADEAAMMRLAADLRSGLGQEMLTWLAALPTSWNSGTLWAVHAGADPAVRMAKQDTTTLLWGHPAFDTVDRIDGQWVAHGHVPVDRAKAARGRLSLDTGAVYGNMLSAARVDPDGTVRFLSA